jgi:hypothetical protein
MYFTTAYVYLLLSTRRTISFSKFCEFNFIKKLHISLFSLLCLDCLYSGDYWSEPKYYKINLLSSPFVIFIYLLISHYVKLF